MHEVAVWSAVTNPCRIKCKKCNRKKSSERSADWVKRNPDRVKKYQQDYRERLKAKGILQEIDKKKREAKKQKKLALDAVVTA